MFAYILCNTNSMYEFMLTTLKKRPFRKVQILQKKVYNFYRLKFKFYRKRCNFYILTCKFYRLKCNIYRKFKKKKWLCGPRTLPKATV